MTGLPKLIFNKVFHEFQRFYLTVCPTSKVPITFKDEESDNMLFMLIELIIFNNMEVKVDEATCLGLSIVLGILNQKIQCSNGNQSLVDR